MIEVRCPSCRAEKVPRSRATFPFCSEACRDRDLSSWTEEKYRIAGPPVSPDELRREDPSSEE